LKILDERQIKQKIKRLAIQILENNFKEEEIILAGINNNGMGFAKMIFQELNKLSENKVTLTRVRLSPADPLSSEVVIEMPLNDIAKKVIIIVDDVANTGRTIFYAMKPLLNILPKKIQVAVLVDRKHKFFPVEVDYVGLSLATTMKESIDVQILKVPEKAVYLN
jgi:pyrimidine operon attenuation protein / uracil phosphoribosyltransferase